MTSTDDMRKRFRGWCADQHDALARFFGLLPAGVASQLDYGPAGFDALEAWLLARYPSVADAAPLSEAPILDGAARYIGETLELLGGGAWALEEDEGDAFHGMPVVVGLPCGDPACPLFLARAALVKRTGNVWRTAVASYLEP